MVLGFIGFGNMAQAIAKGILGKELLKPADIIASRRDETKLEAISKQLGINATSDNREVVEKSDVIILAVKPSMLPGVIGEIRDITADKLVISIAAGKTIKWICEQFGSTKKIIRCMPNTPALVGEACTGLCANALVSQSEKESALELFKSLGIAREVNENLMDVVVGVSGSSPAYVFLFIEAMADAAVLEGMPRDMAYEFAAQAVMGSAKLMLKTGKHPGELKDMVCSPGGTTIEAVRVLEEKGLRAAVMDATISCIEKSKKL